MDRGRLAFLVALLAAVVLFPSPVHAQGCAMCKRALASPEGRQLAAAFRSGILVLLAAPFSLVAVIATLVVRMNRRFTRDAVEPPSAEHRA